MKEQDSHMSCSFSVSEELARGMRMGEQRSADRGAVRSRCGSHGLFGIRPLLSADLKTPAEFEAAS